jgi:hypothetical protein
MIVAAQNELNVVVGLVTGLNDRPEETDIPDPSGKGFHHAEHQGYLAAGWLH